MIHIAKLGGGAGIDPTPTLRNLADRIRQGERWVLVHGTSAAANDLAEQADRPVQTLTSPDGHTSRYTDAQMITLYSAAAASVNQQLTAELASYGVHAAGLAGPNVIHARRKTAIRAIRNGRPIVVRDDHSGAITHANTDLLWSLLDAGYTPVIAPLAMGEDFECLNVDGDLVAATIARQMGAETLIILSNVDGLLRDVADPDSLIPHIALRNLPQVEALAHGRMKKKLIAAQQADVTRVIVASAAAPAPLDAALNGGGTHIVRETTQHEVAYVHVNA